MDWFAGKVFSTFDFPLELVLSLGTLPSAGSGLSLVNKLVPPCVSCKPDPLMPDHLSDSRRFIELAIRVVVEPAFLSS